jgi:acetyl esterase/lipase
LLLAVVLALIAATLPVLAADETEPTEEAYSSYLDVPYVENATDRQILDLFVPDDVSGKVPVVVYVHGGGWRGGSKDALRDQAKEALLNAGFAVATINYTLVNTAIFPQQIYDLKAVIRFLRANANNYGLSHRVGIWGGSAGGQLVALAGTSCDVPELEGITPGNQGIKKSSCPDAVVDFYGPTDFLQMHTHIENSAETTYLGCDSLLECPERVAAANPIAHIDAGSRRYTESLPPFLIAHGDADTAVPISQSNILYTALDQACADVTLYVLEGAGHVFDGQGLMDGPEYPDTTSLHSEDCEIQAGSKTTPLTYQTLVDFFTEHLR